MPLDHVDHDNGRRTLGMDKSGQGQKVDRRSRYPRGRRHLKKHHRYSAIKAMAVALVIAVLIIESLSYFKTILDTFGGLMVLQMRYYVPKEEDRVKYMQEQRKGNQGQE